MSKRVISTEWIYKTFRSSAQAGFRQAYKSVRLDPEKYFDEVRKKFRIPIRSWEDMHSLSDADLKPYTDRVIKSASRAAALEGMGFGLGGITTILPDFGILAAITIRMLQRLSLMHGFDYSTHDEIGSLWLAAASAAGLDFGRGFVEKQAIERLVPKIVDQVAIRAGAEVAEQWAARLVPILSAGTAGALNYLFVRSWGRRAQRHFLERRRALRTLQGPRDSGAGPFLLPSTSPSPLN
jgi:EcsC protein family